MPKRTIEVIIIGQPMTQLPYSNGAEVFDSEIFQIIDMKAWIQRTSTGHLGLCQAPLLFIELTIYR